MKSAAWLGSLCHKSREASAPSGPAAPAIPHCFRHDLGLKFGIYGDAGLFTCQLLPGSRGHEHQDAETWAEWGVDYLKCELQQ